MADESGILVLAEHRNGELDGLSTELLGAARRLADGLGEDVSAVCFAGGAADAARQAITYGADRALYVEDASLDEYRNDTWTEAFSAAAQEVRPSVVLIGQSTVGRDLAPRFAVRAGTGVAMDCIDLSVRDGRLLMTRPCYGGSALAQYTSRSLPQVATLRPKSQEPLAPDPSRSGEVSALDFQAGTATITIVGREQAESEGPRLEDAKVVVSGGRGLGSAEGFEALRELADALGGAVGASRAVVDLGWAPLSMQVGLTGKVVTPDLYVAVGISGASQHLAGITGARTVVAINKDKDANIFKVARYGVVADWKPFLPALVNEVRKLKA